MWRAVHAESVERSPPGSSTQTPLGAHCGEQYTRRVGGVVPARADTWWVRPVGAPAEIWERYPTRTEGGFGLAVSNHDLLSCQVKLVFAAPGDTASRRADSPQGMHARVRSIALPQTEMSGCPQQHMASRFGVGTSAAEGLQALPTAPLSRRTPTRPRLRCPHN